MYSVITSESHWLRMLKLRSRSRRGAWLVQHLRCYPARKSRTFWIWQLPTPIWITSKFKMVQLSATDITETFCIDVFFVIVSAHTTWFPAILHRMAIRLVLVFVPIFFFWCYSTTFNFRNCNIEGEKNLPCSKIFTFYIILNVDPLTFGKTLYTQMMFAKIM